MKFSLVFFLVFMVNFLMFSQVDSNYIELISRDKTIQFHTTTKDFNVVLENSGKQTTLFSNSNWSTGLYLKRGLAELFFALPITAFDNSTLGATKSFGTGFGLNFYPKKFHINYNFKYIQGYESLELVRKDKFKTLAKNNYFIFNRVNIHYVANSEKYSLRSALRFNDRQVQSAGSWILAAPISYHLANVKDEVLENFNRLAIGIMGGYGYTYVKDRIGASAIAKGGLDLRYSKYNSIDNFDFKPSVNIILSTVYDLGSHFIGVSYNYYPEFDYGNDYNVSIENWKLRLYAGRRFY